MGRHHSRNRKNGLAVLVATTILGATAASAQNQPPPAQPAPNQSASVAQANNQAEKNIANMANKPTGPNAPKAAGTAGSGGAAGYVLMSPSPPWNSGYQPARIHKIVPDKPDLYLTRSVAPSDVSDMQAYNQQMAKKEVRTKVIINGAQY